MLMIVDDGHGDGSLVGDASCFCSLLALLAYSLYRDYHTCAQGSSPDQGSSEFI